MSVKNYHAFIRAARKHGGLSLPAARKVAKKVAARLDRPVKGVDVKKHPRIFRESIPKNARRKAAGLSVRSKRAGATVRKQTRPAASSRNAAASKSAVGRIPAGKKQAARGGSVSRQAQSARSSRVVVVPPAKVEYVSTPEYSKSKGGGRLQLQIHIMGPSGLNKQVLDEIAEGWLTNGKTPSGIEVKALGWNGKNPTTDGRGMRVARSNFRAIPFTF